MRKKICVPTSCITIIRGVHVWLDSNSSVQIDINRALILVQFNFFFFKSVQKVKTSSVQCSYFSSVQYWMRPHR